MQPGLDPESVRSESRTIVSNTSFENLVNEHGRQVLGTAMRVLPDVSLAHDVHQEVVTIHEVRRKSILASSKEFVGRYGLR